MNVTARRKRALLRDRRRDNRDESLYGPPLIRALTGWDLYITQQYADVAQLLQICQRPVDIHPNPTVWASDDDARDWIGRIQRGEYQRTCGARVYHEPHVWTHARWGRFTCSGSPRLTPCCYTISHHVQCPHFQPEDDE